MSKAYNVWCIMMGRWTNNRGQDTMNPPPMTWSDAKKWADELNMYGSLDEFVVRELLRGGIAGPEAKTDPDLPTARQVMASSTVAVSQPTRKMYVGQCPCGIDPKDCDYHRP